jgi:hypothetical protein
MMGFKIENMTNNPIADNTDPKSDRDDRWMSIDLSGETVELLEFLADSQGISHHEAIRRAIVTEVYFLKRLAESKVSIQKPEWVVQKKVGASGGITIAIIVFFGVSLLAEFLLIGLGTFYPQSNSDLIKAMLPLLINSLTAIVSLTLAFYFKEQ